MNRSEAGISDHLATPCHPAIAQTRAWVEQVVVGLELCPFARAPMAGATIGYRLCAEADRDSQLTALLVELQRLADVPETELATTLLVYPHGLDDFDAFLQRVEEAEALLVGAGYTGAVQLAHFHPRYQFAGEPADDLSHYTNRAPYPVLHLLREATLTRLLDRYPDPENIPVRNMLRLRSLGRPALQSLLAGLREAAERHPS